MWKVAPDFNRNGNLIGTGYIHIYLEGKISCYQPWLQHIVNMDQFYPEENISLGVNNSLQAKELYYEDQKTLGRRTLKPNRIGAYHNIELYKNKKTYHSSCYHIMLSSFKTLHTQTNHSFQLQTTMLLAQYNF